MKKILAAITCTVLLTAGLTSATNAQTKTVTIENFTTETPVTATAVSAGTSHYDKNGQLIYVVRNYTEAALPANVSSIIKNRYADYAIAGVEEVAIPSSPSVYFVHISNNKKLKTVKVYDGNAEIINSYNKG